MAAVPLPVSGLETRLRLPVDSLTGPDREAAELYIEDATSLVFDEIPDDLALQWEINVPRTVELIIYKAARREWENPSGLSQEISGEHTITTSATSGVFLTPLEVSKIRQAAGLSSKSVGTIALGAPDTLLGPNYWRRQW